MNVRGKLQCACDVSVFMYVCMYVHIYAWLYVYAYSPPVPAHWRKYFFTGPDIIKIVATRHYTARKRVVISRR